MQWHHQGQPAQDLPVINALENGGMLWKSYWIFSLIVVALNNEDVGAGQRIDVDKREECSLFHDI